MRCVVLLRTLVPMKNSSFRVVPLPTEIADAARRTAERGAPDHRIVVADSPAGFPCRHCLRWAKAGERMILFPFAAIPDGVPYSERGPIFVHAERCQRYAAPSEYPEDFRKGRVVRAYDADRNMIAAEAVNGSEPEAIIAKFFEKPETAFVHVRSASHGCYTMEIQRR
jgi:hypothetical protein